MPNLVHGADCAGAEMQCSSLSNLPDYWIK
ncbi:hypothetical protein V1286_004815 [Bradyrhizobium algeriense]|uniref:Uncharacterized protein n=1 Tax=Bradyrhizobium algeriense TaxID=634784 RepID=A0ABU8BGQ4_9BRAD